MILTNKQAMMLYQIAVDSWCIIGEPFKFSPPDRIKLIDEILERQSNTLIDLESVIAEDYQKKDFRYMGGKRLEEL